MGEEIAGFKKGMRKVQQDKIVLTRRTVGEKVEKRTTFVNTRKTQRNEPCPCGSNKKFKHCCLV